MASSLEPPEPSRGTWGASGTFLPPALLLPTFRVASAPGLAQPCCPGARHRSRRRRRRRRSRRRRGERRLRCGLGVLPTVALAAGLFGDAACGTPLALERSTLRHAGPRALIQLTRGSGGGCRGRAWCWGWGGRRCGGWRRGCPPTDGTAGPELCPDVLHEALGTRNSLVLHPCRVAAPPTPRGEEPAASDETRRELLAQMDALRCVGAVMLPPTPEGCALLLAVETRAWPLAADIVC